MTNDWLRYLVDLPPLLSILLKTTVVLALGWGLHFALCRSNPRWRVLVWRGVLVGVVAIPLLQPLAGLEISVAPPPPAAPIREPIPPITPAAVGTISPEPVFSPPPPVRVKATQPPFSFRDWGREHTGSIGLSCWGLVTALLAARFLFGYLGTWRRVQSSSPASDALRKKFEGVAQDLGCTTTVALRTSAEIASPFLTGIRKPVLLVPSKYEEEEHARDLPAILAHECGHVLSRDLWWMFAARWVSLLLWFHPLVWLIQKAHSSACEEVCDAIAADYSGDTESYSGTLARVALTIVGKTPAVGGIPMIRTSEITRRLRNLKRGIRWGALSMTRVMAMLLVGGCVIGFVSLTRLVQADDVVPEKLDALRRLQEEKTVGALEHLLSLSDAVFPPIGRLGAESHLAAASNLDPSSTVPFRKFCFLRLLRRQNSGVAPGFVRLSFWS